jgi:hypothetical protein
MVTNPAGNSVKTDTGYALKLKDGRLVAVTKQQCLENSRDKAARRRGGSSVARGTRQATRYAHLATTEHYRFAA